MKIAIYPGSFSPWHEGHTDVLSKALKVFDQVIIAKGVNPEKNSSPIPEDFPFAPEALKQEVWKERVKFKHFTGLLSDFINKLHKEETDGFITPQVVAVIRGLRNGQDFEFEKTQQYWNEDLDIPVPTLYVISDRTLCHISSSAIKVVKKAKGTP